MGSVAREILVQDSDIFFGGIYNIFFLIILKRHFLAHALTIVGGVLWVRTGPPFIQCLYLKFLIKYYSPFLEFIFPHLSGQGC